MREGRVAVRWGGQRQSCAGQVGPGPRGFTRTHCTLTRCTPVHPRMHIEALCTHLHTTHTARSLPTCAHTPAHTHTLTLSAHTCMPGLQSCVCLVLGHSRHTRDAVPVLQRAWCPCHKPPDWHVPWGWLVLRGCCTALTRCSVTLLPLRDCSGLPRAGGQVERGLWETKVAPMQHQPPCFALPS